MSKRFGGLGGGFAALNRSLNQSTPVEAGDHTGQHDGAVFGNSPECSDGRLAAPSKSPQERSFRRNGDARRHVVQRRQQVGDIFVAIANFDAQRALSACGQELGGIEAVRYAISQTQANQARMGEDKFP